MKKILLAGVAAVAFGSVAAQAAEPVKMEIGGYATQWAGYASNKDGTNFGNGGGTATDKRASFDTQDDVQINFTGSTKLDNGIGVSVEVDTMGTQGTNSHTNPSQNKNVKKSFVAVSTAFGTIEAGEQDNVGALIHNSSPDVGGIGGQDGNWMNWVVAPSGQTGGLNRFNETYQRTYAGDDRSANKIILVSPTWQGITAGFSYTPSIQQKALGDNSVTAGGHTTIATSADYNSGLAGDLYVYGLAYANTFGEVSVKADVGSGNANVANLHVYQGGLNVGYKGFTLGGSYLKRDIDSNDSTSVSGTGGLGLTGYQLAAAAKKGDSWDAGLSYVTGPYGASLTYFHGEAASFVSAGQGQLAYDKDTAWTLAGAYDLGPGVKLTESIFYVDYKAASGLSSDNNNGWAAITGIGVTF